MIELKEARSKVARRANEGRFNLSAVYDSQDEIGNEKEHTDDLSFLDPPNGGGELGFINHYRVLRILGSGGMGLVFEAEDTHLKRTVALKVMRREFVDNYSSRERFLLEARAAASLQSDHIVTVYQVGMAKDVPFLAMQLLHGEPLDSRLDREAPIPMPEAMMIARQVVEGLVSAHQNGLVHRDIKPANIWLEVDEKSKVFKRVKLLDFGLARMLETNRKLTNVGMIVGTPQYMSPEQASGTPVDCRSDLFSLGTVLYVMLTGRLPFDAPTAPAMLLEIVIKMPPRPSAINRLIPKEVDELVMWLMAKSPDDRPNSALDVADAIDIIMIEYSFQMPGRTSGAIGYPIRDVGISDTKLNQTLIQRSTTPTLQIQTLPVFTPVPTPATVPPVENPFADFEIDLTSLPYSPYESSKSRARLPLTAIPTVAKKSWILWAAMGVVIVVSSVVVLAISLS